MSTDVKNDQDSIIEHLERLLNSELVEFFNRYCTFTKAEVRMIHVNNEDFFIGQFDGEIMKAVRAVALGNYNFTDTYVVLKGNSTVESFDDPAEHIDFCELADFIASSESLYPEILLIDEEEYAELMKYD